MLRLESALPDGAHSIFQCAGIFRILAFTTELFIALTPYFFLVLNPSFTPT